MPLPRPLLRFYTLKVFSFSSYHINDIKHHDNGYRARNTDFKLQIQEETADKVGCI